MKKLGIGPAAGCSALIMAAGGFNTLHSLPALIIAVAGAIGFFISMIYVGQKLVRQSEEIEELRRILEAQQSR